SVRTQPRPSRIISAEIISAQSLPRATRPVPRRVNTLHLRFYSSKRLKKNQLSPTKIISVALKPIDRSVFCLSHLGILSLSSEPLHAFDLGIERTLHRLRKVRHTITPNSSSSNSIWNSENSNFTIDESNFSENQKA
ncbi:hypothetical protein CR513_55555, partial [Mucuna pruriens]